MQAEVEGNREEKQQHFQPKRRTVVVLHGPRQNQKRARDQHYSQTSPQDRREFSHNQGNRLAPQADAEQPEVDDQDLPPERGKPKQVNRLDDGESPRRVTQVNTE